MKILGYDYILHIKPKSDMGGNSGFCDFDSQVLSVCEELKDDGKASTLLHEIVEAINYHLCLDLKENQVMGIEAGLFQVLTDNGVSLSPLLKEKYND